MDDQSTYEMPLGPVGDNRAPAARSCGQLEHIFDFRATAIDSIFEPAGDGPWRCRARSPSRAGPGFVGGEIARELRRRGRHVVVLSSGARPRAASSPTTSRSARPTSVTRTPRARARRRRRARHLPGLPGLAHGAAREGPHVHGRRRPRHGAPHRGRPARPVSPRRLHLRRRRRHEADGTGSAPRPSPRTPCAARAWPGPSSGRPGSTARATSR